MKKKVWILPIIIAIPILAAIFGFYLGNKQFVALALASKDETTATINENDNIIPLPTFLEPEATLRKVVWDNIGFNENVHGFQYTEESALYIAADFTSLNSDLKKTLKFLEEIEAQCPNVVSCYFFTFNEDGNKKMLELEFARETLYSIDLSSIKYSDLLNLATNKSLDETIQPTK